MNEKLFYVPEIDEFPDLGELAVVDGRPYMLSNPQLSAFHLYRKVLYNKNLWTDEPRISDKIIYRENSEEKIREKILMDIKKTLSSAEEMGFKVLNENEVGFYLFEFPDVASNFLKICQKLKVFLPEARGFRVKIFHDREDPTDKSLDIDVFAGDYSESLLDKILSLYDGPDFEFLDGSNGYIHISQVLE
jgi:hypothetical protein